MAEICHWHFLGSRDIWDNLSTKTLTEKFKIERFTKIQLELRDFAEITIDWVSMLWKDKSSGDNFKKTAWIKGKGRLVGTFQFRSTYVHISIKRSIKSLLIISFGTSAWFFMKSRGIFSCIHKLRLFRF